MPPTVQTVRTAISTNTAAQNTYAFSPSSNATAGATLVLVVTADNSASAGSSNNISGVTDTKGNTWSSIRQAPLYDNGAASAGIQGGWFDTNQNVGTLTTSDTITVAFSGTTTVARAVVVYQITPETNGVIEYVTGGVGAGETAANGQITTATVQPGQVVFAAYHSENVNAVTGDSDTTNGTWASQETTTVGTGVAGIRHASQYKIQTTAASTQSYDVTVNSQDRIVSYVLYKQLFAKSFAVDATLKQNFGGTVNLDATIRKTVASSFPVDAEKVSSVTTVPGSFAADAVIARTQEGSSTADAVLHRAQPSTFDLDAVLLAAIPGSVPADAVLLRTYAWTPSADAVVLAGRTGAASSDAVLLRTASGSFSIDAEKAAVVTGEFTVEAVVLVSVPQALSLDATILLPQAGAFALNAAILAAITLGFSIEAEVAGTSWTVPGSFDTDADVSVVGRGTWTTPANLAVMAATPTLSFLIPPGRGHFHFRIEIDAAPSFDTPELLVFTSHLDQAGWEYWDGAWQPVPQGGVDDAYAGNEARYTLQSPLDTGTWFRRVWTGVI